MLAVDFEEFLNKIFFISSATGPTSIAFVFWEVCVNKLLLVLHVRRSLHRTFIGAAINQLPIHFYCLTFPMTWSLQVTFRLIPHASVSFIIPLVFIKKIVRDCGCVHRDVVWSERLMCFMSLQLWFFSFLILCFLGVCLVSADTIHANFSGTRWMNNFKDCR